MTMKSRALLMKTVYNWPMTRLISFVFAAAFITGCASIDTERAAEQRKQELCSEIATQNRSMPTKRSGIPAAAASSGRQPENF